MPPIRPNPLRLLFLWDGLNGVLAKDRDTSWLNNVFTENPEKSNQSSPFVVSSAPFDSDEDSQDQSSETELSSTQPTKSETTSSTSSTQQAIDSLQVLSSSSVGDPNATLVHDRVMTTTTASTPPTSQMTKWPTRHPGRLTTTTTRKPLPRRPGASSIKPRSSLPPPLVDEQQWLDQIHEVTTAKPYVAKRDCGLRNLHNGQVREGRVVGGRDSQLGEFPWSVLIRETSLLGFFVKTKCGGVLIDLKWVLTAAHCQPGMFGSLVIVVGGEYTDGANRHLQKPIIKKVKRMIVHRDYNPSNFDNDIALLELESPYQLGPHVVPICLPERDEDFIGKPAMVAGWGKLSFGGPVPNVMQVAKLPVIGNKQCQDMYNHSGHMKLISDSFLCAGYENGGQDSCEGDSGGPLQVQRNDSKWVLVGTVSHGIKCAEPNLPGIYIRTAAYLPWIRAITYHQDNNKRYGHKLELW